MKVQVEQISLDQGILIYTAYVKDTLTQDEDGADYEYDFDAVISNLDEIQNTILRLYGEHGLVLVIEYFANGATEGFEFDRIEFEEGSPLKAKIEKLNGGGLPLSKSIKDELKEDKNSIPTDDAFVLKGWLDALPVNDDLSVMKMLGISEDNLTTEQLNLATQRGLISGDEDIVQKCGFQLLDKGKIALVYKSEVKCFNLYEDELIELYPQNEFQSRIAKLFNEFVAIAKVYTLKKSMILEVELPKTSGWNDNNQYYLLFNMQTASFESKKIKLS